MGYRRPIFILGLMIVSLLVIFSGLLVPPQQRWPNVLKRTAQPPPKRITHRPPPPGQKLDPEEKKALEEAADAQYRLAEYYYQKGDLERAREEYVKLIDNFPYLELDYGFRRDEAWARLKEINKMLAAEKEAATRGVPK